MFAKYTIFVKIAPLMHSPLLAGFHYFHHINLPISSKSPLFKGPLLASKLNICQIGHGEFLPDSPFSSGPIRHFVNFSTSQAAPLVIYLNFHQPASGDYFFFARFVIACTNFWTLLRALCYEAYVMASNSIQLRPRKIISSSEAPIHKIVALRSLGRSLIYNTTLVKRLLNIIFNLSICYGQFVML